MTEIKNNQEQQKVVERVIVREVKVWDTYSYKWRLNSDNIIKRALAVVWYNFLWGIISYFILLIIIIIWVFFIALMHLHY